MFKNFSIPSSYALIKKGKLFLLLKDKYKDLLLRDGIEDLNAFLKKNQEHIHYLQGRTPHPSVPIEKEERMLIRFYSHGGLLRFFTRNLYLLDSRSFRELVMTEEIRSCGIPTIQPVGALHQCISPFFYKASIFSLEAPHSIDLIEFLRNVGMDPSSSNINAKRKIIRSTGLLIRNFHQKGFYHGDLQLKNILVQKDQLLLIDFDRTYRRSALSMEERVKNLIRLNRSAEKWKRSGLIITRTDRLRFCKAYAGEDIKLIEAIKNSFRNHPNRFFLDRFKWTLEKGIKHLRSAFTGKKHQF